MFSPRERRLRVSSVFYKSPTSSGGKMDRKEFLKLGCCGFAFMTTQVAGAAAKPAPCDDRELKFIQNWVTDLMETLDTEMPEETKIKIMDGCGRGCYRRHAWKHEIAAKGKGN